MLGRFRLAENGTHVRREAAAGLTTFMTMAYILCVQPALLARTGMDAGAVLTATCLASALATLLMGLLANYPVALAPAMGHNFFFVFTVCGVMGVAWQVALGANLVAGALFLLLTVLGVQERLVAAIPPSLRHGIAVGIGLFIAVIGLQWGGVVVDTPGTLIGLGDLGRRPVLVFLAVLAVTCALTALRVRGAILLGILAGILLAVPLGVARYHGVASAPPSLAPTFLALDTGPIWRSWDLWVVVLVFLFLDLFDTMGTLLGVATQGGFLRAGRLPRARAAFLSDAAGTVAGCGLGTTTVTSYIESATGIAVGGRTGLAAVVTAGLFLAAAFLYPLVRTVGEGVALADGSVLYPLTAPALVVVGSLMMRSAREVAWDDPVEALPAFLAMILIPLTFSITEGIAFGFVACSLLRLVGGRTPAGEPLLHLIAALFVARWLFF
jgi:AGZA family xanthine/uracil permease-like MFS transporter